MNSVIITCDAQTETMLRRLGLLIMVWRKQLCLTQTDLADRSGILQSYISGLESGTVDPRISTLCKVLRGLDHIPFVTFFGGPPGLMGMEYPVALLALDFHEDDEHINFH